MASYLAKVYKVSVNFVRAHAYYTLSLAAKVTMKAKNPIWGFYTITVEGKKQTAKCNDCQTIVIQITNKLNQIKQKTY